MSTVEQFRFRDRNPSAPGVDLMPDPPITLRYQRQVLSGIALVDSGASISVLPYSLGVQLGFDWQSQTAHVTLTGTLAVAVAMSPPDLALKTSTSATAQPAHVSGQAERETRRRRMRQ